MITQSHPAVRYDRLAGSLAFELDCALREVADAQRSGDFESMIETVAFVAVPAS